MSAPARPARSLRRTLACLLLAACAGPALAEDFVYVVQRRQPVEPDPALPQEHRLLAAHQDYNRSSNRDHPPRQRAAHPGGVDAGERRRGGVDVRGEVEHSAAARGPGPGCGCPLQVRSGADSSLTLEFPDGSRSLVGATPPWRAQSAPGPRGAALDSSSTRAHRELVNPVRRRRFIHTPRWRVARLRSRGDGVRRRPWRASRLHRGHRLPPAWQLRHRQAPEPRPSPELAPARGITAPLPSRSAGRRRAAYRTQSPPASASPSDARRRGRPRQRPPRRPTHARARHGRGLEGLDGERESSSTPGPTPFQRPPGSPRDKVRFLGTHPQPPPTTSSSPTRLRRILMSATTCQAGVLDEELPAGDYLWRIG